MTTIETMKPDAKRLLDAARDIHKLKNFADVARLIGESEQTLSNWKKRGVPKAKTVSISGKIGCRPEWLEMGALPMIDTKLIHNQAHEKQKKMPDIALVADRAGEIGQEKQLTAAFSADERLVLDGFRLASPRERDSMLHMARLILEDFNKRNEQQT